jgi:hypothetical protein
VFPFQGCLVSESTCPPFPGRPALAQAVLTVSSLAMQGRPLF